MKLAANISYNEMHKDPYVLFSGFEKSIPLIRELGFDGVEFSLRDESELSLSVLERLLLKNNLEVSCITTGRMFSEHHLYFTSPDATIRQQAIEVFCGLIRVAKHFDAMINIGRVRGYYAYNQSREEAQSLLIDSLSYITERTEKENVTIVIEPLNRYEINFINSIDECMQLLQWISSNRIAVMPDLFHMNIEDALIGETLVQYPDKIKYIHFADSNRRAPGWGHIDYDDIFAALDRIHYSGWGCIEAFPLPSTIEAAQQSLDFLHALIRKYSL